ncbi:MAG: S8 family serine peptidase, partial [Bacteroidia bacterium]|nr:S8 family serine peptidase [Bacteroidia bacterium]
FLGGKDGKNVHHENLEITRVYKKYKSKYQDLEESKVPANQKVEYQLYKKAEESYLRESAEARMTYKILSMVKSMIDAMEQKYGKQNLSIEDIQNYEPQSPIESKLQSAIVEAMQKGANYADIRKEYIEGIEHYGNKVNYHLNPDFEARGIVGDQPEDMTEKYYGNADVKGPDADHGTHVAGIIAANRANGIGIKGVATPVQIMAVRCVPDGDERDKDIANAIRYAADNGAKIINMSFGKAMSPNKRVVDEAIQYAASKDVLLIHAAGNDAQNNDVAENYPNDNQNGKEYTNAMLEVGACSWERDENAVGNFSNYGKKNVDVFAPGVAIYSTLPESSYGRLNGTSMAAPAAAGVAALIRAYYPKLTAPQVKQILMKSVYKPKDKPKIPGGTKRVTFKDLSRTGGVVNAYNALKLAAQMSK